MPVFNIENLEDAQAVVRHYGFDLKGCGKLTEQGLADHVYMCGITQMDAAGFAGAVESYMDQADIYQLIGEDLDARLALDRERFSSFLEHAADARAALAEFIQELRAEPEGAAAWTALAELATQPNPEDCTQDRTIRPQLPGVLRILERLKEFEPCFRESLSLDYAPGESVLLDALLRADIERLDATLSRVPRRGREANAFLELAALLRLVADAEFSRTAAEVGAAPTSAQPA